MRTKQKGRGWGRDRAIENRGWRWEEREKKCRGGGRECEIRGLGMEGNVEYLHIFTQSK